MKPTILFLILTACLWPTQGKAQVHLFGPAGRSAQANGFHLSQSFGEPMVQRFTNDSLAWTEGFQQAWLQSDPSPFAADSVWPGDANYDGIANNLDLLPIGLNYGLIGPARPNASLAWQGQPAQPWLNQALGIDSKHQDCDGNALIDAADTLAIQQNYGLQHQRPVRSAVGVPLYAVFEQGNAVVGDTIRADIFLGADTSQLDSAYGVAFSLTLDSTYVDYSSVEVRYPASWLGQAGTDMLSLTKVLPQQSRIDLALTRIDQQGRAGHGLIASVAIIMIDDLAGKLDSLPMQLGLIDAHLIDLNGQYQPVATQGDSLMLLTSTGLRSASLPQPSLYPNPARDRVLLRHPGGEPASLTLIDAQGRILWRRSLRGEHMHLTLDNLAAGTYLLKLQTASGQSVLSLTVLP